MHIRERALGPVICATTCIGLFLVAEIALWGYGYDTFGIYLRPDELAIRRIANIDDPMAYELTPGFSGNGFATKFTINRAGFRGPWPRREAAATVLFLGDSVAFGYGLQDSETVAAQLERILNTKGESVQVLNFGVPGYDVLDVVRTLKQKGPAFEPDLVIILYCLNDVGVVSSQLNRLTSLEGRRRNPLLRSRLIQFVTRKLDRVQDQSLSQRMNKPLTFREAFADQIEPVFDHERELASLMKRAGEGPHPYGLVRGRRESGEAAIRDERAGGGRGGRRCPDPSGSRSSARGFKRELRTRHGTRDSGGRSKAGGSRPA